MKNPGDKMIVALDGMNGLEACSAIEELAPHVWGVKLGLELISGQQAGMVADFAVTHGVDVFWDEKFSDNPQTVSNSVGALVKHRVVKMLNVHCMGGLEMMHEAKISALLNCPWGSPLVLGVTVLTGLDYASLFNLGFFADDFVGKKHLGSPSSVKDLVVKLAYMAQRAGLDGVVASPHEVAAIRAACGPDFVIVTPGIRPTGYPLNDQKRFMTPAEALLAGSDYLVIGRPITQPQGGMTRVEAVQQIVDDARQAVEEGCLREERHAGIDA